MGTNAIDVVRANIEDMKKMIELSEIRMNQSIAKLSERVGSMSSKNLTDVDNMKRYVTSVLRREETKINEDSSYLEFRIQDVIRRNKELESRIAITEHECINKLSS